MERGSTSGAHVVLVPAPAFGHTIAFFYLAERLVHLGVRVTFLVVEWLVPRFLNEPLYAAHWSQIQHENIELVAVKDGFSHLGDLHGFFAVIQESSEPQLVAAYSGAMAALMSSTRFPAPCCIIADMLMGWTQEVAAKFNIPGYMLYISSAANLSLQLHVPTLIAEGRLPLTATNQEEPVHIPGLNPLQTSELPDALHIRGAIPDWEKIFMRTSWRVKQAPIVLVNTFRELEEDVFEALDALHSNAAMQSQEGGFQNPSIRTYLDIQDSRRWLKLHYVRKPSRSSRIVKMPKVIPVGPLLPSPLFSKAVDKTETNEADERIMRFLDKHPPQSVVYVAFGSVPLKNKEKQFQDAALGLEASGQPFLWAEATRDDPNAISLAGSLPPPGFVERTKERGMILNAVAPQQRILQHPATGAFLSHCGWNSVIESIVGGVPILAVPLRSEHRMNARFMVDVAKVAVEFKGSNESDQVIPREEVERVVRLVTQEEEGKLLRSNVEYLKQSALKNMGSLENLQTFLALCGSPCNPVPAMSKTERPE